MTYLKYNKKEEQKLKEIKIPKKYQSKILKIRKIADGYKDKDREFLLNEYNETKNTETILAIGLELFSGILQIKLYDVQIYAALAMIDGKIVEMKTGEGKSFVSVLVSFVRQKYGKVYIVTINDTLAERDCETVKKLYEYIGLKPVYAKYMQNYKFDASVYECDVIFTSVSRLIFDFLYDKVNFKFDSVLIDEIDYILIDNANSQFSLSKQSLLPFGGKSIPYNEFWLSKRVIPDLKGTFLPYITDEFIELQNKEVDYYYLDDYHTIFFTYKGMDTIKEIAKKENLPDVKAFYFALYYSLQAKCQYIYDRDYIVEKNNIVLINKNNGRLMYNSKKELGLQVALEVKEGCQITQEIGSTETISMQLFFLLFNFMTGMSGTVGYSKNEFKTNFKKKTAIIPTNLPIIRQDIKDKGFKYKQDKYEFALNIIEKHKEEPFLVVVENEKETEEVNKYFKEKNIEAIVLNNHNIDEETNVINKYKNKNQIVLTTTLLGRGTDIKLSNKAKEENGLIVILLDKFKNKRIENQIRGRSGRQGEKGISYCLYSLEDMFFYSIEKKLKKKIEKTVDKPNKNINNINKTQQHLLAQEESQRFAILEIDKLLFSYFEKISAKYNKDNCEKNIKNTLFKNKKEGAPLYKKFIEFQKRETIEITNNLFSIVVSEMLLNSKDDLYKQILDIGLSMNVPTLKDSKTEFLFFNYISPALEEFEYILIKESMGYMLQLQRTEQDVEEQVKREQEMVNL